MRYTTALMATLALGCASQATALPHRRLSHARRQAPNTLYPSDPENQTASFNATYFVVPIPKAEAQKMAGSLALLPPQGLPAGFIGADEHPYVLTAGLFHDIRQLTLEIPNLSFAAGQLPFVDGSNDGSTPFTLNVVGYMSELVPVLAGSLQQGTTLFLGNFDPSDAAAKDLGDGMQSFGVALGVENDGLAGIPTPDQPVLEAVWSSTSSSPVDRQFFRGVLTAPYVHTNYKTCSQTKYVFDETFAEPYDVVSSTLQTMAPTTESAHSFSNVYGTHVTVEWDNPFGPGSDCASMRSQAQAIQY